MKRKQQIDENKAEVVQCNPNPKRAKDIEHEPNRLKKDAVRQGMIETVRSSLADLDASQSVISDFPPGLINFVKKKCDEALLSTSLMTTSEAFVLKSLFQLSDFNYLVMKNLSLFMKKNQSEKHGKVLLKNLFTLMKLIQPPKKGKGEYTLTYQKGFCKEKMGYKKIQQVYIDLWIEFSQFGFNSCIHMKILKWILDKVLPHAEDPTVFCDFFFRSFQKGSPENILALHGLFILINKYNMEYPDFYLEVYDVLSPSICYAKKHRSSFFKLLDLLLSSTHISSYLAAAFCKKLSRLSLTAPAEVCLSLVDIVSNLIVRHSVLKCLLDFQHNPDKEPTIDPFAMDKPPEASNALKSSLWEIKSLENHWHPDVCRKAVILMQEMPKIETQISWPESEQLWQRGLVKRKSEGEKGITLLSQEPHSTLSAVTSEMFTLS